MLPLPVMLLFVVPISAAGTHLVDAAACMCPDADGTVVAADVVVPSDMHGLPVVGAATVVVVVVEIIAASVTVATIVAVSVSAVFAGVVGVGVSTLIFLHVAVLSTLLVCLAQICPYPFFCRCPPLSCSCSVQKLFLLRVHACTFVHVGLNHFDIRQVDLFLVQWRTPVTIIFYVVST